MLLSPLSSRRNEISVIYNLAFHAHYCVEVVTLDKGFMPRFMNLTLELPATGSSKLDASLQEDRDTVTAECTERDSLVPDQMYGEQTDMNYEFR